MKTPVMIPKDKLVTGAYYLCEARNFTIGRWNGKQFEYIRKKFSQVYVDREDHWDDGAPHGTVKPYFIIQEDID